MYFFHIELTGFICRTKYEGYTKLASGDSSKRVSTIFKNYAAVLVEKDSMKPAIKVIVGFDSTSLLEYHYKYYINVEITD